MTDPRGHCCDEYGCKRKNPILVRRGGLSGRWFVVTAYKDCGNGYVETTTKHDVTDDLVAQLTAAGWTPPLAPESEKRTR